MLKQFLKGMAVAVVATAVGLGCATQAYAQSRAVNGKVTDSKGEPVIGASVFVVGSTNHGTETDLEGNYSLSVPSGASLNFSCIGYATEIVPVGDRTVINVTLKDDTQFIEETVVIGYGVQKKSDVTGAIASVKDSDIANRSSASVAQVLQGKAAGVQIVNPSGAPGSESSIQIRGYSSNSKTTPLMIVDGLKVSDINYLDPESIASIEVLKDAASAPSMVSKQETVSFS